MVDAIVKTLCARDESSVDQEELAFEAMSERAAHGRLAGAGRTVKQNAAFGAQTKTIGEFIVLERQDDIDLEAAQHVVHPFQVLQVHLLDFSKVHVAGEALGAEVFNEQVGRQFLVVHEPLTGRL